VAVSIDSDNLGRWRDGHFTRVAEEHVGAWLSAWISIGGALSAVGLLNTLMCTAARVAVSAARLSVLPRCLGSLDSRGTPTRATITISLVLAVVSVLPFSELVSISMLFYGATTCLEFLALIALRHTEPTTPRPFRVPLSDRILPLACLPPVSLCLLLVFLAPPEAWLFFIVSTALSMGSYYVAHGCHSRAASACWRLQPASAAICPVGRRSRPRWRSKPKGAGYDRISTRATPLDVEPTSSGGNGET